MPLKKRSLLTDKEKLLLDRILDSDSVKTAAGTMGITLRTAYNTLYRIRHKYGLARHFVNTILVYRRKTDLLERVLTKRVPIDELEE